MSKRICHPGTAIPIVTGNLQMDSARVKSRKKKVLVPGQAPAAGPAVPFGPQLPGPAAAAAPSIPTPPEGSSGTITIARTPAGAPRLKYEDITGTATRHHIGKGAALAPKMPAAVSLGRVHRTRRGAGITRRMNR
jgi:hypothetical protein